MSAVNPQLSKSAAFLERPVARRKMGIVIAFALSAVVLVLSLPFVSWITLSNPGALFAAIGVEDYSNIFSGYTLYNFLSFVQESGRGTLGFPAMLLMVAMVAAALFHLAFLIRTIVKPVGEKGYLKLYSNCQVAMLFTFFVSLATIFYVMYANRDAGVAGYACSPVVYIVMALSMVGYLVSKTMERPERIVQHEHGFCKEFKKNWILFLFLVPCFVYFIINNYLPMTGVYFAFTQFNFRDGLFASPFVGFKNFEFLVKSNLGRLTFNTIAYNIVFIGLGNVLQIFFAILVSQVVSKWFKKTSQTLIFMPDQYRGSDGLYLYTVCKAVRRGHRRGSGGCGLYDSGHLCDQRHPRVHRGGGDLGRGVPCGARNRTQNGQDFTSGKGLNPGMILTLDIGNTNIKCALFEDDTLKKAWRMATDRHKTHDEYGVLLMMFLNHAGYEAGDVEGIILSSVVPTINYTIEHMIDDYFGIVPLQVEPGIRTGINIRYDNPQALGADRICNAVAAQKFYGGPCIFIDFGTATSFGVISKKGEFLGGAICPGVKMSSEALTERAAQLPKVELVKPDSVIQRNTITNMQAGIVYGYVGQVDYIVRKMKAEIGGSEHIRVIATGGMARMIASETSTIDIIDGQLTLKGLRLLYERNAK